MSQEIPTFFHFVFYHLLLSLFILSFLPSLCETPILLTALWSHPLFCSPLVSISLSHSVSWSLLPTYSEYVGCTKMSASWDSTDEMKTQQFRQDRKIKCKLFLCPFWPPPSSHMSPLLTRPRWKNLFNHKDQFFFLWHKATSLLRRQHSQYSKGSQWDRRKGQGTTIKRSGGTGWHSHWEKKDMTKTRHEMAEESTSSWP